jgi:hypothetical protein
MKKILLSLIIPVLFFGFSFYTVFAQQATGQPAGPQAVGNTQTIDTTIDNPFGSSGANTLEELFTKIIENVLFPIGSILAIISFIYAGFLYVTAQGSDSKIKTAHKALLYTAIGTAVLLGAEVLSKLISSTINQLR